VVPFQEQTRVDRPNTGIRIKARESAPRLRGIQ